MDRKGERCRDAGLGHEVMHRPGGQRSSPLREKHIRHAWSGVLQLAEGPEFGAPYGRHRRHAVFDPSDMDHCRLQIQHIPAEAYDFGDP